MQVYTRIPVLSTMNCLHSRQVQLRCNVSVVQAHNRNGLESLNFFEGLTKELVILGPISSHQTPVCMVPQHHSVTYVMTHLINIELDKVIYPIVNYCLHI